VKIYTFIDSEIVKNKTALLSNTGRIKSVLATDANGNPLEEGFYKSDIGKGDSIVILDSHGKIILYLDYWLLPLSLENL